jgi:transposase
MAYELKYRLRALEYWGEGHSKRKTAEVFKVSTSTLQQWKSKLNEYGTLEPKKLNRSWRKIDPAKLSRHIENHPDAYLREIAEAFDCSIHAIEKALARLKISRKKNACVSREK